MHERPEESESLEIAGVQVRPGQRKRVEIPIARLPTENWMSLPVEVVYGARPGVRVWINAAVHGDELNGVEIIRQVLERLDPKKMSGCLLAAPIVNVFGFVIQSRYLPDRRDLNRSFPGSKKGSLAGRLAHLFMAEIVDRCTYGIDLHTGSNHRTNLPQVRCDLADAETRRLAEAFAAPVLMTSQAAAGSLRKSALKRGKRFILYEAGEPLRFDDQAIETGVAGVMRVLHALEMLDDPTDDSPKVDGPPAQSVEIVKSRWLRARRSGIARLLVELGDRVKAKQVVAHISDAFGDDPVTVKAPFDGLVIGHTNNPLVHQGDAIIHLGQ